MHPFLSRPENFIIPNLGLAEEHLRLATMVYVPGGAFRMGSKADDPEASDWEKPDHDVTLPSFFIGQFPLTQAIWKAVLNGDDPAFFKGDNRPVEQVSWDRITKEFLPTLERITGMAFRLPTEAEWEYAALGGPEWQNGFQFSGSNKLKEVGWFIYNSHGETKPVGLKYPNQLGLYDMSGNVWEWLQDEWHGRYNYAPEDGSAWITPRTDITMYDRIVRGGNYRFTKDICRVKARIDIPTFDSLDTGFRLSASFQLNGMPNS